MGNTPRGVIAGLSGCCRAIKARLGLEQRKHLQGGLCSWFEQRTGRPADQGGHEQLQARRGPETTVKCHQNGSAEHAADDA